MIRAFFIACVSLLLVGMQQHAVRHEIDHLRARIERGHDVVVQNPAGGTCIECSLLAAGSGVIPTEAGAPADVTRGAAPVALAFESPRAQPFPASYLSRAPPAFV